MAVEQKIRLNFLDIDSQSFNFSVYRKIYVDGDKEEGIFRYRLPQNENENPDYADYSVSFSEIENYEKFKCKENYNINLTEYYLYRLLSDSIENQNIEHKKGKKFFDKNIDIFIKKHIKGNEVISLMPYYLKSTKQFGFLIDFQFKVNQDYSLDKEVLKLSLSLGDDYRSNKKYYSDVLHKISSFIISTFKRISILKDTENVFSISEKLVQLSPKRLNKKVYRFKGEQTDLSQFQGIRKYGVYEGVELKVKYVFVFEDKFKDFANNLFFSLIGKSNPGTFSGLQQFFNLPFSQQTLSKVSLKSYSQVDVLTAITEVEIIRDQNIQDKLIVIFLEPNRFEGIPDTESPYYLFKFHLTKKGIPVQVIRNDQTNNANALKWSTSNIALQIFAKLGGTPWKVQPTKNNCLILGIGSSHEKDENGKIKKFFSYSVCLDSSGIYKKLDVLAEETTKEEYLQKLQQNLTQLLRSEDFKQYKKCALHLSESIKKDDVVSIEKSLSEINGIEFKVLKVNAKNKFFGFSDHNTGIPYESSYIKLANNEYLIWFDGLVEGKETVFQKVGNPIHIKFLNTPNEDKESDLTYLQDAINLSGANWRGFNAKQTPISIYYAKIVADYTAVFSKFESFDKEMLANNLPWFL
ncbi:hypothetical protein I5M32_16040 [Pedobacter sp. SD-b]|uniref:Protein argonaute n=1 Tax=Pedobacter segetis TaxID=2793069 RepID=A0ABS1BNX3_9SPHI|nr:Piwi domain-containing protein [Pedobacter segetis]MBK0384477.1 hypothetical protein [Pedobacter segetis]